MGSVIEVAALDLARRVLVIVAIGIALIGVVVALAPVEPIVLSIDGTYTLDYCAPPIVDSVRAGTADGECRPASQARLALSAAILAADGIWVWAGLRLLRRQGGLA